MHRLLQTRLLRQNVEETATSCLPYLATTGNLEQMKIIKQYSGFRTDSRTRYGDTALHCAIGEDHKDVAVALIGMADTPVNMQDAESLTIIRCQVKVVRRLLERHDIRLIVGPEKASGPPLIEACRSKHDEIMQLLLAFQGIDVRTTGKGGQTALHAAAEHNYLRGVEILLDDGRFNPSAKDHRDQTAMDIAFKAGHFDIIELLHLHGVGLEKKHLEQANAKKQTFYSQFIYEGEHQTGRSICACAAAREHLTLVTELLPVTRSLYRCESLLLAASYGRTEIVKFLLNHVRPDFEDETGHSPEWWACENGHFIVLKLFKAWKEAHFQKRKRSENDQETDGRNKRNAIVVD